MTGWWLSLIYYYKINWVWSGGGGEGVRGDKDGSGWCLTAMALLACGSTLNWPLKMIIFTPRHRRRWVPPQLRTRALFSPQNFHPQLRTVMFVIKLAQSSVSINVRVNCIDISPLKPTAITSFRHTQHTTVIITSIYGSFSITNYRTPHVYLFSFLFRVFSALFYSTFSHQHKLPSDTILFILLLLCFL